MKPPCEAETADGGISGETTSSGWASQATQVGAGATRTATTITITRVVEGVHGCACSLVQCYDLGDDV